MTHLPTRCRELEPALASYVDGESEPRQRDEVDAHLERCPPCRDRVAAQREAREVLRARRDQLRARASDTLRARCAAHAKRTAGELRPARSTALRFRRFVPLSLAATLLLAVAGVVVFGLNHRAIAAQFVLDHLKCFDVIGEEGTRDVTTAETTWQARRGWSIAVAPPSREYGLELVGVRRCFSTDGAAAHCMYRWRDRNLSVYIVPHRLGASETDGPVVEKYGQRAIMWAKGDRTYVIVTRGRPEGFEAVAEYIRRTAR